MRTDIEIVYAEPAEAFSVRYTDPHTTQLLSRILLCDAGRVDEKPVMHYIEPQKWDHDNEGFKVTAPNRTLSRLLAEAPSGCFSREPTFSRKPAAVAFR